MESSMNIYILAPENHKSGGAELSHQFCNAVNRVTDVKAYMCYASVEKPYPMTMDSPAPEAYRIYNTEHATSLEEIDRQENVVVFPEGLTLSMLHIKKARKAMWWMSVDNYLKSTDGDSLAYLRDNVEFHLYQSYYAKDYIDKNLPNSKSIYVSDYINEQHGQFIFPAQYRQNIALYNPAKGYEDIKPLIEKASWLKWIPIINLDVSKIVLLLQSGKIYVDFGNHPGKDRIPREAASDGCCVITNRKGAAAFEGDVPIPEDYKFEDPAASLDEIDALLHDICDNFEAHQKHFEGYREMIRGEKAKFDKDVAAFVSMIKG
mgnify:CR=1 FL=1